MPIFKYIVKDYEGKKASGEVEAVDQKSLIESLRKEGLVPLNINRLGDKKELGGKSMPTFGGSVSSKEIVNFTRQLSTMLSAGLPLIDGLTIMQKQTKNQNFSRVLQDIVADVQGGTSLSKSLSKHPKAFDVVYIKLIEAGEAGGVLDKVLLKLAQSLEKDREFKAKTRGAFIYPAIVVSVMVLVVVLMMIFVIPKLTGLYEEIGTELPLPTRVMIAMSDFTRNFWWLLLLFTVGFFLGFRVYSKTPQGADKVGKLVLSLPIWGKIRRTLVLTEFTRTLGLILYA